MYTIVHVHHVPCTPCTMYTMYTMYHVHHVPCIYLTLTLHLTTHLHPQPSPFTSPLPARFGHALHGTPVPLLQAHGAQLRRRLQGGAAPAAACPVSQCPNVPMSQCPNRHDIKGWRLWPRTTPLGPIAWKISPGLFRILLSARNNRRRALQSGAVEPTGV